MNRQRSWPVLAAFLLATAFLVQCSDSQDDNSSSSSQNGREVAGGSERLPSAATDLPTGLKLLASDKDDRNNFGYSVSISNDTALVGAPFDSAYVFVRSGSTWSEQQKLTPNDRMKGISFGHSVSISGDTALVGVPYYVWNNGVRSGSAYVFVRSSSTWSEQERLFRQRGTEDVKNFGYSVSISGDTALVGSESEAAYVFVRSGSTWSQQQELTPNDNPRGILGGRGISFGHSVSISNDMALIGAPEGDGKGSGSAYVFVRSDKEYDPWIQQHKLTPKNGAAGDHFGTSVSISGDTALVGFGSYIYTIPGK